MFRIDGGEIRWYLSFPLRGPPAVSTEGTAYLVSDWGVTAIGPEGDTLWETPPHDGCFFLTLGMAVGADGVLHNGCCGCDPNQPDRAGVGAFSPTTGELLWIEDAGGIHTTLGPTAIDADGNVHVLTHPSGNIELLSLSPDGEVLGSRALNEHVRSVLVGPGGVVVPDMLADETWVVRLPDGSHLPLPVKPSQLMLVAPSGVLAKDWEGQAILTDHGGRELWQCANLAGVVRVVGDGLLHFLNRDDHRLHALVAPVLGPAHAPWPIYGHDSGRSCNAAL